MLFKKTRDDNVLTLRISVMSAGRVKEVSLSPEGFLQAKKKARTSGGTFALKKRGLSMIRTRGLEEQRVVSPEGCQAKKP